jgi:hypothetical protein
VLTSRRFRINRKFHTEALEKFPDNGEVGAGVVSTSP